MDGGALNYLSHMLREGQFCDSVSSGIAFFPDDFVNYDYPKDYNAIFGCDYEPPPYIMNAYQYCRNHKWYMAARLITVNDDYAFNQIIM